MTKRKQIRTDSSKGGRTAAAIARAKEAGKPLLARHSKAYQDYLNESTGELKSLTRRYFRGF